MYVKHFHEFLSLVRVMCVFSKAYVSCINLLSFLWININDTWMCYCFFIVEDLVVMKVVLEKMVQLQEKPVLKVSLAPFAR